MQVSPATIVCLYVPTGMCNVCFTASIFVASMVEPSVNTHAQMLGVILFGSDKSHCCDSVISLLEDIPHTVRACFWQIWAVWKEQWWRVWFLEWGAEANQYGDGHRTLKTTTWGCLRQGDWQPAKSFGWVMMKGIICWRPAHEDSTFVIPFQTLHSAEALVNKCYN